MSDPVSDVQGIVLKKTALEKKNNWQKMGPDKWGRSQN
jgi:hypothetical protein